MMSRINRIKQRIKRLLPVIRIDDDGDGFIAALVGDDKERYTSDNGGYDAKQALSATAAEDWKNENY